MALNNNTNHNNAFHYVQLQITHFTKTIFPLIK